MATGTEKVVVAGAAAAAAAVAASGALKTMGGLNAPAALATPSEAARFLTQCTFGPTDAEIASVQNLGFAGWIDQQMAMTPFSMLAAVRERLDTQTPYRVDDAAAFVECFWKGAITRPDQLRQRMQFALSQIFVLSRENETIQGLASLATTNFYDILGRGAFGNWRTLLEQVALNPTMGIYLSYVKNDKEDPATGRTPDENFAREVMQLFSIGTILLKPDGTPQRNIAGATIPAYGTDDIKGLAKVFTGISWFGNSFLSSPYAFFDGARNEGNPVQMMYYPQHHSTSEKKFLGVTIPASATPNPAGDVQIALDRLFNHQNTAPYFAKRLIQQFVTSNPTPAYVARVGAVFVNNGQGVRGDMGAVLRAVLMDAEARDTAAAQANPNFGKLREPMIRVTNWARAFDAQSRQGHYSIGETGAPNRLAQGILDAPSVFNFWRAGYVPPHTTLGRANLRAPEFQVVSELTTAAYANLMRGAITNGIGTYPSTTDVYSDYAAEIAMAADANALLDRLNLLLFYGQMSASLRSQILAAVNSIPVPGSGNTTTARTNRAKLAILLSVVSGEYLAQR